MGDNAFRDDTTVELSGPSTPLWKRVLSNVGSGLHSLAIGNMDNSTLSPYTVVPELIDSAHKAVTAPARAYRGEIAPADVNSEAINFGLNVAGGSVVPRRPAGSIGMGGRPGGQTPFYGSELGPKGRIADPAGEAARLEITSGLAGAPAGNGFFNPATSALLQGGVHPKNTTTYYQKQLQGRGVKLPPGQWEMATEGLGPRDVVARDELVKRFDDMAPRIEHHRAGHLDPVRKRRAELDSIIDEKLARDLELPNNYSPERQAEAWEEIKSLPKPNEPKWQGYTTKPIDPATVPKYTETAIGYKERDLPNHLIDRSHDSPVAADIANRSFRDGSDDLMDAAMTAARGWADKRYGNVGVYSDRGHMGHMMSAGSRDGPNLEGWIRSQTVDMPSGRTLLVDEAQDQRRRMMAKQGPKPGPEQQAAIEADLSDLSEALIEKRAAGREFLGREDVSSAIYGATDPATAVRNLQKELRDVDFSRSINFDRGHIADLLAARNPGPYQIQDMRSLVGSLSGMPHLAPQEKLAALRSASEAITRAQELNTPSMKRYRHDHAGGRLSDDDLQPYLHALHTSRVFPVGHGSLSEQSFALGNGIERAREAYANKVAESEAALKGVEPSPYSHSKPAASGLLARQAIQDATLADASRIAWPTGGEQALRYNLGSHVSALSYNPRNGELWVQRPGGGPLGHPMHPVHVPHADLASYVGDDLAFRLLASPGQRIDVGNAVVGGRGMKSFYGDGPHDGGLFGSQVQSMLNKLDPMSAPAVSPMPLDGLAATTTREYPSLPLSAEAKRKAREIGLPLYAAPIGAGIASGNAFMDRE